MARETMVRMGELAVSRSQGDVLVALGLGSCIGLVLIDRAKSIAGLAHVMLPDSASSPNAPKLKFADHAVPELVRKTVALGSSPVRLQAFLVGGAKMFSFGGSSLDVGARNEEATLAQLEQQRIRVAGCATAGTTGRTVRVHVDGCRVFCKEAGGVEKELKAA
ncbi:MAG TPA: chemotaxis protein CheD [Gaiellaceae bacterium]|nr:chemotaxis protein CheD [Gaiellaceae bacterium]